MSGAIFKYELYVRHHQEVMMPEGARILSVQAHNGCMAVWALVDTSAPIQVPIDFFMVGTNKQVDLDPKSYLGTVQFSDGLTFFAWHVFAVTQ